MVLAKLNSFYLSPWLRREVELFGSANARLSSSDEGLFATSAAPHPNPLPASGERERAAP
ncbi:hypothetical protein GGQ85_000572 [Nitrobacter vulgaris]|nr:hypothetical protein [Nitrobacter vulgaris]